MTGTTPSGVFLTPQAMMTPQALSTAWNAMFAGGGGTIATQPILQDLTALTQALNDPFAAQTSGITSRYALSNEVMGLLRITSGITDDTKSRSIGTERRSISDVLGKVPQGALLWARLVLFGRNSETFLTRESLASASDLTSAWSAMFSGAELATDGGNERALEDLAMLAMALGRAVYLRAGRLVGLVESILSKDTRPSIESFQASVADLLKAIPDRTLAAVRDELYPQATAASSTGLAPATATPISITIEGKPISVPDRGVRVYPLIEDPANQVGVKNPNEELDAARNNTRQAVDRYLSAELFSDYAALLPSHVDAIISGQIGSPVADREAAIKFLASSPEHAAAYGTKILQEALVANVATSPVPIMIDLDGLTPVKVKPPEVKREPRAQMAAGGADNLKRITWDLQALLLHPTREEILALGRDNPGTFGISELVRLIGAAWSTDLARNMKDPTETAVYIYDAEMSGTIPPGYIKEERDPEDIEVRMPEGRYAREDNWQNPLTGYIGSDQFAADIEAQPRNSTDFPFHDKLKELYQRYRSGPTYSTILSVVSQGRHDDARRAIITLRKNLLRDSTQTIGSEYGLRQMDHLEGYIAGFLDAGNLRHAEALLDFAEEWTNAVIGMIRRVEDIAATLYIIGERRAKDDFEGMSRELLTAGELDTLWELIKGIKKRLKELRAPVRIRARQQALTGNIASAVLAVLESARSLGALSDPDARLRLAARVPSVQSLMEPGGPATPAAMRALLKSKGIPLPGEPGVEALSTGSVGGLRLPPPAEQKAISAAAPANGEEQPEQ